MKIKNQGVKKKPRNSRAYHWWLVEEKPKKVGRLAQRNKHNKRLRKLVGPSEFQIAARQWDEQKKGVSK